MLDSVATRPATQPDAARAPAAVGEALRPERSGHRLQSREKWAFSPVAQDAGIDAVQPTVHPHLQLIGVLSAHPFSQLLDGGCPSAAILLEHLEQRARPFQPPSIGITAGVAGCVIRHGVPFPMLCPRGLCGPGSKLIDPV